MTPSVRTALEQHAHSLRELARALVGASDAEDVVQATAAAAPLAGSARRAWYAREMLRQLSSMLALAVAATSPAVAQCSNFSTPWATGCGVSSPFNIPVASCSGSPTIGNGAFAVTTNAPCFGVSTAGLLVVGTCRPPILLPTGPGAMCASQATCALYVDIFATIPGVAIPGGFSFSAPVPNIPQLAGLQLCVQSVAFCSANCFEASQGLRIILQ